MNRPVHFEIHAADARRAMAFYTRLFGWKFAPYGPPDFYWLVTTGEDGAAGINGGLVKRTGATPDVNAHTPVIGYVVTVDVEDVDSAGEAILEAGGFPALGKQVIPGVGWTAYYKDTEANIFGIFQADKNAK